jgi:hypothetical protein
MGTKRKRSGNKAGTKREQSGNNAGTKREQSGSKQGTNKEQTGNNTGTKTNTGIVVAKKISRLRRMACCSSTDRNKIDCVVAFHLFSLYLFDKGGRRRGRRQRPITRQKDPPSCQRRSVTATSCDPPFTVTTPSCDTIARHSSELARHNNELRPPHSQLRSVACHNCDLRPLTRHNDELLQPLNRSSEL